MPQYKDHVRATLFLFLHQIGLPEWAQGDNQPKALALLAGWDEERARKALNAACQVGYATKEASHQSGQATTATLHKSKSNFKGKGRRA